MLYMTNAFNRPPQHPYDIDAVNHLKTRHYKLRYMLSGEYIITALHTKPMVMSSSRVLNPYLFNSTTCSQNQSGFHYVQNNVLARWRIRWLISLFPAFCAWPVARGMCVPTDNYYLSLSSLRPISDRTNLREKEFPLLTTSEPSFYHGGEKEVEQPPSWRTRGRTK